MLQNGFSYQVQRSATGCRPDHYSGSMRCVRANTELKPNKYWVCFRQVPGGGYEPKKRHGVCRVFFLGKPTPTHFVARTGAPVLSGTSNKTTPAVASIHRRAPT